MHRRNQSTQILELLSPISISAKVLSHNLISFSVLRVKGSSQGSGLFLRKLIPIFIAVHCCDLKLFKHRQKKWQCLGAPEFNFTKMKVNLSKWSTASSVTAGGFCCSLCSCFLPWQKELRVAGCLAHVRGQGSITVPLLRHQAPKMLMRLEITFALQRIQFVLALYGISVNCLLLCSHCAVNNAAVRWLSRVKILVTNKAGEIKNTLC